MTHKKGQNMLEF